MRRNVISQYYFWLKKNEQLSCLTLMLELGAPLQITLSKAEVQHIELFSGYGIQPGFENEDVGSFAL